MSWRLFKWPFITTDRNKNVFDFSSAFVRSASNNALCSFPKNTANGTRNGSEISGIIEAIVKLVDMCQMNKNISAIAVMSETIGSSKIESEKIRKYIKKKYGDCKAPLESTVYVAMNPKMLLYISARLSEARYDCPSSRLTNIKTIIKTALISRYQFLMGVSETKKAKQRTEMSTKICMIARDTGMLSVYRILRCVIQY